MQQSESINQFWENYHKKNKVIAPYIMELMEFFYLKKPKSIIDIGCGMGHYLNTIPLDVKRTGIDISKFCIDSINKNSIGINAIKGDISDSKFKFYETAELVFTCNSLCHIKPNLIGYVLNRIFHISEKYILFIEPDTESDREIDWHGIKNMMWAFDIKKRMSHYPVNLIINKLIGPNNDYRMLVYEKQ